MIGEETQQEQTAHSNTRRRHMFTIAGLMGILCLALLLTVGGLYLFPAGNHTQSAPTPTPTPSPSQVQLTATAMASRHLFIDDFTDKNTYKDWFTGSTQDYERQIGQQGLSLTALNHKVLIESLPPSRNFDDFQLTTEFTFQQGDADDSIGIYLRGDGNLDHDYRIDIHGNTTYSIVKESWDTKTQSAHNDYLVPDKVSPHLHPMGSKNTLTVSLQGSSLSLILNGSQVEQIEDASYTKGQIALFVHNGATSSQARALFNKIVVDPLPPLPTPTP